MVWLELGFLEVLQFVLYLFCEPAYLSFFEMKHFDDLKGCISYFDAQPWLHMRLRPIVALPTINNTLYNDHNHQKSPRTNNQMQDIN